MKPHERPDYPDGLCPECLLPPARAFDLHQDNFVACPACRTYWRVGYGMRTGGLTLTDAQAAELLAEMSGYREVEPAFLPRDYHERQP